MKEEKKIYSLSITQLPPEIQVQFLIRLPPKSILECRRVCKTWNRLITEPFFAKLHRSVSPLAITLLNSSENLQRTRAAFIAENSNSRLFYNVNITNTVLQIVGSCNGLMCISSYDPDHYEDIGLDQGDSNDFFRVFVCNPIVGAHLLLPDPPRSPAYSGHANFGFGFSPSTGRYKVVKIQYMKDQKQLLFHVCTIQRDKRAPSASSWKTIYYQDFGIGVPPLLDDYYSNPAFFNGSIIWIAKSLNSAECHSLIYFDIEKEQVQTLSLPRIITFRHCHMINQRYFYNTFFCLAKIGVYYDEEGNDHLYLCDELPSCANIWVMEDYYKCTDSLKLKWVIQLPLEERVSLQLFKVRKDGKLLIAVKRETLVYYDPTSGVIEKMKNMRLPGLSCLAVDIPNMLGFMLQDGDDAARV